MQHSTWNVTPLFLAENRVSWDSCALSTAQDILIVHERSSQRSPLSHSSVHWFAFIFLHEQMAASSWGGSIKRTCYIKYSPCVSGLNCCFDLCTAGLKLINSHTGSTLTWPLKAKVMPFHSMNEDFSECKAEQHVDNAAVSVWTRKLCLWQWRLTQVEVGCQGHTVCSKVCVCVFKCLFPLPSSKHTNMQKYAQLSWHNTERYYMKW